MILRYLCSKLRSRKNDAVVENQGVNIKHKFKFIWSAESRTNFNWFLFMIFWKTDALMMSLLTFLAFFNHLIKTNRLFDAACLFRNRSQTYYFPFPSKPENSFGKNFVTQATRSLLFLFVPSLSFYLGKEISNVFLSNTLNEDDRILFVLKCIMSTIYIIAESTISKVGSVWKMFLIFKFDS